MVPSYAVGQLKDLKELSLYGNPMLKCEQNVLERMLPDCAVCCDSSGGDTSSRLEIWFRLGVDSTRLTRAYHVIQIMIVTGSLGLLETSSPNLLAVFGSSVAAIICMAALQSDGPFWVAVLASCCAISLYGFRRTVKRIEGMEACHAKYCAIDSSIGIVSAMGSELVPPSQSYQDIALKSTACFRRSSSMKIVDHAHGCVHLFDEQIVRRMAYEAVLGQAFRVIGPIAMDLDHVRRTADLEHGGDVSSVKGVLNCDIYVVSLTELCAVWAVLEEIAAQAQDISITEVQGVTRMDIESSGFPYPFSYLDVCCSV